jgi:hypothetical protein
MKQGWHAITAVSRPAHHCAGGELAAAFRQPKQPGKVRVIRTGKEVSIGPGRP